MLVASVSAHAQAVTAPQSPQGDGSTVQPAPKEPAGKSAPLFRSLSVNIDLVGPLMLRLSDHGEYQGTLQASIRGKYLPVIEFGYGKADKYDDDTRVSYTAKAPFGRIGCDYNILKNKLDNYRLVLGMRYGYTSFSYDMTEPLPENPSVDNPEDGAETESPSATAYSIAAGTTRSQMPDGGTPYVTTHEKLNLHWLELVFGVDAKIYGPLHMGWSLRYRKKISCSDYTKAPLYAPGYGDASNSSRFMALYTVGLQF